jgi:hypothetical protein
MKKSLFVALVLATGILLLCACSSPEKDGAAYGAKINKCNENHLKALQQLDADFGQTALYKSRNEAKASYYSAKEKINATYAIEEDEIYKAAALTISTYKDYKSRSLYEKAFVATIDDQLKKTVYQEALKAELPPTVLAFIRSIVPPKPGINQIQKDLVGHSLSEGVDNGYYPSTWQWVIRESEISDFAIDKVLSDTPKEYLIIAKMRLTSEVGKSFDATVKIRYLLPDDDDWSIDFIQSQGMYIVKSLLYNDCVKLEKGDYWYYLVNKCDVALEVGGKELHYHGWEKYVHVVPAHSKYCMYYPDEITIDYVERP